MKRWQEDTNLTQNKLNDDLTRRRFVLTTDMWISAAKRGYMVVTIHYINRDWEMRHCIIAFTRVLYPNTGERLDKHMIQALNEMDRLLIHGMWKITGENASRNSTMISSIKFMIPDAKSE